MSQQSLRPMFAGSCAFYALPGLAGDLPGPDDKPFAEAHIVLQLSDGDEGVQSRVLNVAGNLLKHYGGPDLVDLEIVAFGPGISLLFADGDQRERVSSLAANGVIPVQVGVAHIVERSTRGFVVVRP